MKPRFCAIRFVLTGTFALLIVLSGCRVSEKKSDSIKTVVATSEEQEQAAQSVRKFLAEIDKENGESWEQVSQMLKSSTSQTAWALIVGGMNTACGKKLSRGEAQGVCTDELPNSPKGRYIVFDIPTKFERADLTERVVLVLENGQWKVAGYFRKKTISFGDETKRT